MIRNLHLRRSFWPALAVIWLGTTAWLAGRYGQAIEAEMSQEALQSVEAVAANIPAEQAHRLNLAETNEVFRSLQTQLAALGRFLGQERLYILGLHQGTIVYGPEIPHEDKPGTTRHGTVCPNPTAAHWSALKDGTPAVIGPQQRPTERVVTAIAPVRDPRSGKVIVAVAMDSPSPAWDGKIFLKQCKVAGAGVISLALLILLQFVPRIVHRRFNRGTWWLDRSSVVTTASIGITLTFLAVVVSIDIEDMLNREAFRNLAQTVGSQVRETFKNIRELHLATLARFIESTPDLTRQQFSDFASTLVKSSAVQAFEWVPRVPGQMRGAAEARAVQEGWTNFLIYEKTATGAVVPAGPRAEYFPVFYIEPVAGNELAAGFDLASEPVRRGALEESISTRSCAVTPAITLVQETGSQKALLAYHPVWSAAPIPGQPGLLRGFALVVLRLQDLLNQILVPPNFSPRDIRVQLVELDASGAAQVLARSDDANARHKAALQSAYPISFLGRAYGAVMQPGTAFLVAHRHQAPWVLGVTGILLTAAASALVGILENRRSTLEREVQARTNELQEREEFQRTLLENLNAGVLIIDAATRSVDYANSAAAAMIGLPATTIPGRSCQEFCREATEGRCAILDFGRQADNAESLLLQACGSRKFVLRSTKLIKIGDIPKIIESFVDINHRIKIEAQLSERTALLTGLLNSIPDIVFFKDRQGTYLGCNPRFAEFAGRGMEQIIGRTDHDLFPAAVANSFRRNDQLMMESGEARHNEEEIQMPDGTWLQIDTLKAPLRAMDGSIIGVLGVSRDVSARKRTEQRLSYREAFERSLVDLSIQLVGMPASDLDPVINESLGMVGRLLGVDRSYVFLINQAAGTATNTHEWCQDGVEPQKENLRDVPNEVVPAWMADIMKRRMIEIPCVQDLPPTWQAERDILEMQDIQSVLVVPLATAEEVIGFLGFDAVRVRRDWGNDEKHLLGIFGGMLASTIRRQRSEMALRESQQNLQAVFDRMTELLFIVDYEGRILACNPAAQSRLGYAEAELVGLNLLELHPADKRAETIQVFQAMLAGQTSSCRIPLVAKSKQLIPVETEVAVTRWNQQAVLFGVSRDVSERNSAEEALRASEKRLLLALEGAGDAFWDWNVPTGEVVYGEGWAAMLGYDADVLIPSIKTWENLVHPEDLSQVHAALQDHLEGRTTRYLTEHRLRTKSGTWAWILDRGKIVEWDSAGKPLRICGTHTDITLRKRLEEDLRDAKEAADAANRAKTMFLANMSHEIRTPMNAILGFNQLLRHTPLNDTQRQHLDVIGRSGDHLLDLINDILDMSRIETGRVPLHPAPFNLQLMLEDLEKMFRSRAAAKSLFFEVIQPGDLPAAVEGDERKLRQVFINLLNNAIKFTDQGGIHLRVRYDGKSPAEICLQCEIQDTGVGIAPEELGELFQAFGQTSSGRKSGSGTGLGLAISREFVRLMGGEISVESHCGQGSTFRFEAHLQRADGKSLANDRASARRVVRLRPDQPEVRVLVVDDNLDNRHFLAQILEEAGFTLREAGDGVVAVALAESWRPQLILMDTRMPVMNGHEATTRIRQSTALAAHPPRIITVTANAFEGDLHSSMLAGADAYLAKPIREPDLFTLIEKLLGIKLLNREADSVRPVSANDLTAACVTAMRRVPEHLIKQLGEALIAADFDRVSELLREVSVHEEDLAASLQHLADQYDSKRLLDLVATAQLPTH